MLEEFHAGQNQQVMSRIDRKLPPGDQLSLSEKYHSAIGTGDEVMWRLEAGAMNFHVQRYAESIGQLRRAEELIAEYDERALASLRDISSESAVMMTNLAALPYRGFCRDRIALSIYKSLAYLGTGNEAAFRAQLRRLRDEQKKVQEDYEEFFNAEEDAVKAAKTNNPEAAQQVETENPAETIADNPQNSEFNAGLAEVRQVANRGYGGFLNPAAIFLSGLGSIRDNNFENARIDFQRLYEARPESPLFRRYYVTVLEETGRDVPEELAAVEAFDFPLNRDCVYVLFANGRSAAFKQIAVYFPAMAAWPMCEFYPAPYTSLRVTAGGQTRQTELLADMDGILAQEFNERLPGMITRIVLSTAIKEAAKYTATYAVARENVLAGAGVYLGSAIYTAAVNTADTRSWELLPKEFQLTQCPMPEDRRIVIDFGADDLNPKTVELPGECGSAIVLVSAPSDRNVTCHLFPLE